MLLPILYISVAAASGIFGVGKTVEAANTNTTATKINKLANDSVENAKNNLNQKRTEVSASLEALGQEKIFVLNNSIHDFLNTFEKIKNVDFTNSVGLEELKNLHVAKEDRIRAQMRIMEILPATRGKLTTAEKERFAFCIYLEFCIRVVDEEKGRSHSGIVEFTSVDHILKEFHEDKAMFPERYAAAETFTEEKPFGYSMNHPICSETVGSSYQYLNRLLYLNGRIASHVLS